MLGAIGFETDRRSWLSRIIRWFTESRWSHVFIVAGEDPVTGETEILEASTWGIQKAPLKKYLDDDYVKLRFYVVRADPEKQRAALAACQDLVGRSYGYAQILGFALILPFRKLGLRFKNPISAGRVCSELVLRYLQLLDVDPAFAALDRDSTTPQDLFAIIDASPRFEVLER